MLATLLAPVADPAFGVMQSGPRARIGRKDTPQ
jgi:hypothetical protein